MSADFWTSINMKGTDMELLSLLKIVRMYTVDKREQYRSRRDCPYLDRASIRQIGGKDVKNLSDDDLLAVIKESDGQINIEASGPYGIFGFLEEVTLFEEMANAAPTACFKGVMSGSNAGGDQDVKAVLENGMMKVFNRYPKLYIPIPAVNNPALYVAQRINKGTVNVVFEKHNFVVSDSCRDKNAIIKAIESRGGKIRKSVGKTTHYVILGQDINGYDRMAIEAIKSNTQEEKNIEAVTEDELLALVI